MGKKQTGQRTKGNVKPSNSLRAAELLETSGVAVAFTGFSTVDSGFASALPGFGADDVGDSGVEDADFSIVLKRLSKKDSTTKLKAMQEFAKLCQEKDANVISAVLPQWPKLFIRLSVDQDNRVRESTHQAFEQLIMRVRRSLAPHLRSLMGPWLVAQCDGYGPAASSASSAFKAAFTPIKQSEAIAFCRAEIVAHIEDNLFRQTPLTLSDPRTTTEEERIDKYFRLLAASLEALNLFFSLMPRDQHEPMFDTYRGILKNGKFWKLVNHPAGMVRCGVYNVLSAVCSSCSSIAAEFSEQISSAALYSFDEDDPNALVALWTTVLQVLVNIEDCWVKVNLRKAVFPKLWSLLKDGGRGCASTTFYSLLPFISKVPLEQIGDGVGYYEQLFDSLKTGLMLDRVQMSSSECNAVVTALMECAHFAIGRHLSATVQDVSVCNYIVLRVASELGCKLVEQSIMPLLESSFTESRLALSNSNLYSAVVDILCYLHSIVNSVDTDLSAEQQSAADMLYKQLSSDIAKMVMEKLATEDNNISTRLIVFVTSLSASKSKRKASAKGVKFSEPEVGSAVETSVQTSAAPMPNDGKLIDSQYISDVKVSVLLQDVDGPLWHMICDSCWFSLRKACEVSSTSGLGYFSTVFGTFVSINLLKNLLARGDNLEDGSLGVGMSFFRKIILPWVSAWNQRNDRSADANKLFVSIIWATFGFITPSDKVVALSDMLSLATYNSDILVTFCQQLILWTDRRDEVIVHWVRGEKFGQYVVSLTKGLCRQIMGSPAAVKVVVDRNKETFLCACLTSELLIGCEYMNAVFQEIEACLPSGEQIQHLDDATFERCIEFVCDLALNFFTSPCSHLMQQLARSLLLELFRVDVGLLDMEQGHGDTWRKVRLAWSQGFDRLLGNAIASSGTCGAELFHQLSDRLISEVSRNAVSVAHVQHLADAAVVLWNTFCKHIGTGRSVIEKSTAEDLGTLKLSLCPRRDFDKSSPWRLTALLERIVTFDEISNCCLRPVCEADVSIAVHVAMFSARFLASVSKDDGEASDSRKGATNDSTGRKDFPENADQISEEADKFNDVLINIAAEIGVCQVMTSDVTVVSLLPCDAVKCIETDLLTIIRRQNKHVNRRLVGSAFNRAMSSDDVWSLALGVIVNLVDGDIVDKMMMTDDEVYNPLTTAIVSTLNVVLPLLPSSFTTHFAEMQVALLLSCPPDNVSSHKNGATTHLAVFNAISNIPDATVDVAAIHSLLALIKQWRDDHETLFLFDATIGPDVTWPVIAFNIEVAVFLTYVVRKHSETLSSDEWDLIMCGSISWLQSVSDSLDGITANVAMIALAHAVFGLLRQLAICMQDVVPTLVDAYPTNLNGEWKDVFAPTAYGTALPLFVKLAEFVDSKCDYYPDAVLKSLGAVLALCSAEHLLRHRLPCRLVADDDGSGLPDNVQTLVNHCCPLLASSGRRSVRNTVHHLLMKLVPALTDLGEAVNAVRDSDEEVGRTPPRVLMAVIDSSSQALVTWLDTSSLGDTVEIFPMSAVFSAASAYLLTWSILLKLFQAATPERRSEYARHICRTGQLNHLMATVFRLMPQTPNLPGDMSQCADSKVSSSKSMFSERPSLDVSANPKCSDVDELRHLSCAVYLSTLETLPAAVRQWWTDLDKRSSDVVDRFTSRFVSPILCTAEFVNVQRRDDIDGMKVRVRPTAREVVALYAVGDVITELVITLPANFPLGAINAGGDERRVGVQKNQWRKWILQLTSFLTYRNGSLIDGLTLWKRNADKRFDGVEECTICFSVLHASSGQLPHKQCRTCHKHFHAECLYRWFETNNTSSCPLCRNLF